MNERTSLPSFAAIVVAAGKGLRAGGDIPKQFAQYRGKPLMRHSVEALRRAGASPLIVVIGAGQEPNAKDALAGVDGLTFVTGGVTRQDSVRNGLEALAKTAPQFVLIHDAARADLPGAVIERLLGKLAANVGAIPVLPVVDSLAVADGEQMSGKADREELRRVQTPQAFHYKDILSAHRAWQGATDAGDDAQVLMAAGGQVGLVDGDERLKKITFAEDLMAAAPQVRVGQGFDVHRLVEGEELWLCGLRIPHNKGLSGHSDADVALHCVVDAFLGAIGDGDIGSHFPPSDPQWKGAPSPMFVEHAVKLVDQAGYRICNVDLTLICEEPKIGPHRDAMRARLAELLRVDASQVSIKATTTERLGFTGRGEGIAAQAMVSLQREI
uniref:bifunctional 2-C-methyl-D-erythritol 4-phosphate cytidylyltransferase/2-C-methyl-D-erythritol 2,4-cyclodiphosphate synthase n=1 Tax=uncultured Altererythrobacter sp. TaxID=500840 RepID=UPI002608697C|nr:bifunctional 2-C-methyl-D-erythritol 4-phosphate cytidylyltransferase/2-C-methyl-D-erythritol 2,4-cyclodiphosphate synthase [uncultured Altererythrobacter sp.]